MENISNIKLRYINNRDPNITPFSSNFNKYIEDNIDNIFIVLNNDEKKYILDMVKSLVTLIFFRFNFESENQYFLQLSNNSNRDIKMIIMLLFPYINSDNDFELCKNLFYLKDISIKNNDKYITNIQYDRSYFDDVETRKDYEYNLIDIYNNYISSYHTIYKCAHHLYCDWTNIIPLTIDNFQKSYIYKDTVESINKNGYIDGLSSNKQTMYSGIDVRDIYHVCINDLFTDIVPFKWLIYEKYDNENKRDVLYIEEIFNHFGYIFNNKLDIDINRNDFVNKWYGFTQLVSKDKIYKNMLYYILKNFHINKEKYLDDINTEKLKNIKLSWEKDDDEDDIIDLEEKLSELMNIYSAYNIYIYDYLKDVINSLSKTWYGKLMFSDKITNKLVLLKDIEFNKKKIFANSIIDNSYITYKNIYNYVKSLLFDDDEVYNIKEYDGLTPTFKNTLLNRLNDSTNSWFTINPVLKEKYGLSDVSSIKNKILDIIKPNFIEIIFHGLITRGILSEFRVKYSPKQKEEALNGYYFVTQQKYNELSPYLEDKNDVDSMSFQDKILNKPKVGKKGHKWTGYFAMNWLQQIHFYKHFFNQRVMYITGGTGVGKSTQIPKLLWYGLFLIGVYNGKIINTQPRVNAATNNAKRISLEMGVPIEYVNYEKKKTKPTVNYYVQYETEKEKHVPRLLKSENISPPDSSLQIVTDGTLLVKLKTNTYFKEKSKNNKYNNKNLYDIVAIDEAHEHNTNMDLILTLIRDVIQINNSVRLVIITATIDEDEPIYRRYYKKINDNLLAPLNNSFFYGTNLVQPIRINYIYNKIYNYYYNNNTKFISFFDRISIDRRIHISPPSNDTMYKITEEYTKEDINTYDESEKLGLIKTKELVKVAEGDILFFSTSTNKINGIVNDLNNSNMPSNWIALPYYAQLLPEWLEKVNNIGKTRLDIEVDRKDLSLIISNNSYDNYRKVSKNQYNRYIIVATNVAEASITIETLKYVIETGWQVSVSYDPILDIEKNEIIQITESSRKQRKGRVGRTGSGTVFYMYKKDSRKNNVKKFPITLKMNELIYDLCELLTDGYYTVENNEIKDELVFNNINIIEDLLTIDECVKFQYYNNYTKKNTTLFNIEYMGFDKVRGGYSENNYVYCYRYKSSGYDIEDIFDLDGKFFLVHPFEGYLKRDSFTGDIIKNNKDIMKIYEKQFNQLFKLRLIVLSKENNSFIKTILFTKLQELLDKVRRFIGKDTTYSDLMMYILGNRYNLVDEVNWVNTILKSDGIETLAQKITTKKGKEVSDSTELQAKFGDKSSDLNVYVNILNKVKMMLPKLIKCNEKELKNEIKKDNSISELIDNDDFKLIKNIEKKDENLLSQINIFKNKNEILDEDKIEKFSNYYGLDSNVIIRIIRGYIDKFRISNIINKWVIDNKAYIPYFNTGNDIRFIYISVYSSLNNIDDMSDIKRMSKDPNSKVIGKYIHSIRKIQDQKNIVMVHLSNFNPDIYTKAIIPAFILPLKDGTITWSNSYEYYRNITPAMIEEYLLPEDKRNNKLFNEQLLQLFSLFRKNS